MLPVEIRFSEIICVDEGWLTGTHLMCYLMHLDTLMTQEPKPQTSLIIRNPITSRFFLLTFLSETRGGLSSGETKMVRGANDKSGCY